MPKITFIGAGSTVFAKNLLGDILSLPELASSTIALHDIDETRLGPRGRGGQGPPQRSGLADDRGHDRSASALDGADYVITMFQVGGYEPATVTDFEIPKRYGLDRPSATPSASAASCAACGRSRCCSTCAATWRRSAATPPCSTT